MYNAYQNQISPFTPNIFAIFLVFRDDKENGPAVFYGGAVILEEHWTVTHATRSAERRQESCESGYYYLHPNLNKAITLHTRLLS